VREEASEIIPSPSPSLAASYSFPCRIKTPHEAKQNYGKEQQPVSYIPPHDLKNHSSNLIFIIFLKRILLLLL
jgi:hypothetical protein